ncbi:hypothetical protein LCGC14_3066160, partial [marine sediment metagenome]
MRIDIKSTSSSVYDFLASKILNIFLSLATAVYGILLVVWAATSPPDVVYRIGTSLPFKLVLVFFLVNNLLCLIRQFPLSLKACQREEVASMEKIEKGRHSISKEPLISVSDQSGLDAKEVMLKIASFLRRSGYRVGIGEIQGSGETLFASRGRYASLATLVFHISLFAVAGGILLGALYSTRGSIVMAEGERFTGKQSEYTIFYPKDRYNKRVSAFSFKVDDVPAIWYKNAQTRNFNPTYRLGKKYEPFYYGYKGNPILAKVGRDNVFEFPRDVSSKRIHPTEKP